MASIDIYSEEEIIKGCANNNRFHQEILYKKYFHTMYVYAMKYTKDEDEALSIVNDGFLKVFKNAHQFSFKGSLEGWIRRIVFHAISDYFKSNAKYLKNIIFEEVEQKTTNGILDKLFMSDLIKLINKLPPATAKVFKFYAIEGFTHKEIGDLLNISAGTSKWHFADGRKKLQQMLASITL